MKPSFSTCYWDEPSHLRSDEGQDAALFWWLGQAGFLIEVGGKRIVIDAYLSNSLAKKYEGTKFPHTRMMPPPVNADALLGIDILLCTHAHTDHMDAETIEPLLAANPNCQVVVPRAAVKTALARGVPADRMITINAGETLRFDGVSIYATPSAHEELHEDDDGFHYLGYLIESSSVAIWHSGDTIPFPGLAELLMPLRIDVALLPVNGRDTKRAKNGVPGNLKVEEALELAQQIGVSAVLAHHFGMFDFNTVDPIVERQKIKADLWPFDFVFSQVNLKYSFKPSIERSKQTKVLMVCRGNICRSPIAHGILQAESNSSKIFVDSAAIMDWNVGKQPDVRAIAAADKYSIDIGEQIARQVKTEDFYNFDVIYAMDNENLTALNEMSPRDSSAQIGLMGNLVKIGSSHQIADPYYGDQNKFHLCFSELKSACQWIINKNKI